VKLFDRVAAVAAFNDDGQLLFGLRGDGRGWCLPGGHFNEGENPLDAAKRELQEETGLISIDMEYLGSARGSDPGISVWAFKCLVAGEPDASQDPDGEFVEFRWVDPGQIPAQIRDDLRDCPNVVLELLGVPHGKTIDTHFRKADPDFFANEAEKRTRRKARIAELATTTSGSAWNLGLQGFAIVGRDPHNRQHWRCTWLDENKQPKSHLVAATHEGALEHASTFGANLHGAPMASMKKSLEPAPFDPHQAELVRRIQDSLSDELRRPEYQGHPNRLHGHCSAATEAIYHLLGGTSGPYVPHYVHHEGSTHWFLRHKASGHIIDPTADQFQEQPPYEQGRGCGFQTPGGRPSHRAKIIIERAMNPLVKAEAAQHWRSQDGLRIPVAGTPERRTWNKKFVQGIADAFAGGEHTRLKPTMIDVEQPGLGTNMAVNRPRLQLYRRMLGAGEKLPPVVVQRSGEGWRLLDGNHRLEAARALGHKQLHALEVTPKA
jgi:8-oxo-dGTP pyrophosphatase MutT (NUDIX family)